MVDFNKFLPEPAAQARIHTQNSHPATEGNENVKSDALADYSRRKRAKHDRTDDEDGDEIHNAAKVAKRIPDFDLAAVAPSLLPPLNVYDSNLSGSQAGIYD